MEPLITWQRLARSKKQKARPTTQSLLAILENFDSIEKKMKKERRNRKRKRNNDDDDGSSNNNKRQRVTEASNTDKPTNNNDNTTVTTDGDDKSPSDKTTIIDNLKKKLIAANVVFFTEKELSNLAFKKTLGSGSYGSCTLHKDRMSGRKYVIKTFLIDGCVGYGDLATECLSLMKIQSISGVQKLVGVCFENRQMVTKYAGTSLHRSKIENMSKKQIISIILKIVQNVKRINDAGIIHNDLKPANICLNEKLKPVIIDFGLATESGKPSMFGTYDNNNNEYPWIAPELFESLNKCTEATEVYSLAYVIKHLIKKLN
ncbi:serine/threonine protein kinase [Homarus gammarus nudivirus]|uniref:Serine/threonine protein kinase n=1 Tax=Homarus gammarus nudivirus TaxID=2509616 RepID=A0A411HB52_9VIRU|nr:serine/threonine protein kinase [Homarus gammarus nudivirus]QBB28628.1 serine/threonine protein kinase [Homarus gammarus nudivirus]